MLLAAVVDRGHWQLHCLADLIWQVLMAYIAGRSTCPAARWDFLGLNCGSGAASCCRPCHHCHQTMLTPAAPDVDRWPSVGSLRNGNCHLQRLIWQPTDQICMLCFKTAHGIAV